MDFTQAFHDFVEGKSELEKALEVVRLNSTGKIWLIGGFLYRGIVHKVHGTEPPVVDFDFIVEEANGKIKVSEGWRIGANGFGNPKFLNEDMSVDFVPLTNVYSIIHRGLPPRIEHFLTGVPLTVQTMVYDFQERRVIGDVGSKAIESRTVAANDIYFAKYAAQKKGLSLKEMIIKKAKSLRFTPIFYHE
jgi:hypothetical protein